MKSKISKIILLAVLSLLAVNSALAYIDAGTGSMLLGAIGPMIGIILAAIAAFFLKHFIAPIKRFFTEHRIIAFSILGLIILGIITLLFYIIR